MRSAIAVGSLAVAALLVSAAACSFTTNFDDISGGTPKDASASGDAATAPAEPPARPAGAAMPGGGKSLYLGVKHFHFAHSNDALKVPGAWQDWGYDIDHLCTGNVPAQQNGTCIHSAQVTAEQVVDGKACRDNNFGSQVVPQLNTYNNTFENDTNAGLTIGSAALMFELDDLTDGADDPYVPGKIYILQKTADKDPPAWDGTDLRPVLPRSVTGGDVKAAVVTFPEGYLVGNVWVSGPPKDFEMSIPIGKSGELMTMSVVSTVFAMKLNETHISAVDGTGVMAGAIPVSKLETFLKPFLLTQTSFCPGTSQYKIFMDKVVTFADVVVGAPSLQDPAKSCDGISFGIGFNMAPVAAPTSVGMEPVPSNGSCDAGTDSGSDTGTDSGAETGTDSDAATD